MANRATVLFAGIMAIFATASCPAMATVFYVTYQGTAYGVDTFGVFGAAGANLSGVAYTTVYTYDPSHFGNAYYSSIAGETYVYGGSNYNNTTDPILSASITINGQTHSQSSSFLGQQALANLSGVESLDTEARSSNSNYLSETAVFAPLLIPSLTALQSFAITAQNYAQGQFSYGSELIGLSEASFTVSNVALSPTSVPEPATLTLLAGFVGLFAAVFVSSREMSSGHVEVKWQRGA